MRLKISKLIKPTGIEIPSGKNNSNIVSKKFIKTLNRQLKEYEDFLNFIKENPNFSIEMIIHSFIATSIEENKYSNESLSNFSIPEEITKSYKDNLMSMIEEAYILKKNIRKELIKKSKKK